jgi:hypothetical protein
MYTSKDIVYAVRDGKMFFRATSLVGDTDEYKIGMSFIHMSDGFPSTAWLVEEISLREFLDNVVLSDEVPMREVSEEVYLAFTNVLSADGTIMSALKSGVSEKRLEELKRNRTKKIRTFKGLLGI